MMLNIKLKNKKKRQKSQQQQWAKEYTFPWNENIPYVSEK